MRGGQDQTEEMGGRWCRRATNFCLCILRLSSSCPGTKVMVSLSRTVLALTLASTAAALSVASKHRPTLHAVRSQLVTVAFSQTASTWSDLLACWEVKAR